MAWTAVVLTASKPENVQTLENELAKQKSEGLLDSSTELLVVEDPKNTVGSGGATINALLVVTEFLSAKNNFSVVNPDCMKHTKILVIHIARAFVLDPCGRAFVTLPLKRKSENVTCLLTNFNALFNSVTKLAEDIPEGVWICSTDMLLDIPAIDSTLDVNCDVIIFTVPGTPEYATKHGVVQANNKNDLANILYQGSPEEIGACSKICGDIPVLSGIVYLNHSIVEKLVSFSALPPLDACTYIGYDSGSETIQISLFFDLLLPMCSEVSEVDFVSGSRSGPYGKNLVGGDTAESGYIIQIRSALYRELSTYTAKVAHYHTGQHSYLSSNGQEYLSLLRAPCITSFDNTEIYPAIHCFVEDSSASSGSILINSIVEKQAFIKEGCCMSHSILDCSITVGKNSIVNGVWTVGLQHYDSILLPDELVLQTLHITTSSTGSHIPVPTVFGLRDDLTKRWTDGSYCGHPWTEFYTRTGVTPIDLWPAQSSQNAPPCLFTAKLFPVSHPSASVGWSEVLWLAAALPHNHNTLDRWRSSTRHSLQELLAMIDLSVELNWRRHLSGMVTQRLLQHTLVNGGHVGFSAHYRAIVINGQGNEVLQLLDKVAGGCEDLGVCARALASIADVLGAMAMGKGALRSGPAANESWQKAFAMLETGCVREGVQLLAAERANWLNQPTKLVRAARHYEGAAQILIRQAVKTARQFISTNVIDPTPLGAAIVAVCPARIDLSGGWSDTPPITYEHGGAVTNAAITIDGKKPIGAKVRRIQEPHIVIHLDGDGQITDRVLILKELSDFYDYCQPHSAGALVKTALICADIIKLPRDATDIARLQEQLLTKYSGGFEISTWSNLPTGSGLGTSSILAGAIMAALWTASGRTFDITSLNHCVLYLEQMLTTGGGWQDQVGGLLRGIKMGYSAAALPLKVEVKNVEITQDTLQAFNDRLMLVYTGKTRLARNLLQEVVRNWYARNDDIMKTEDDLVQTAHDCAEAFQQGDLEAVGACMDLYWEQKKRMAPGCEPEAVRTMMNALRPLASGLCMAGAGGGGFLYVLLKSAADFSRAEDILKQLQNTDKQRVTVHHAQVDMVGLEIFIDGKLTQSTSL